MRTAFLLLPLVFLLNVCASPTSFGRGFAIPIKHHRRALKPTTGHKLFDAKFFQNELEGLFVKYAQAGTILQSKGLTSNPPFPVVAPANVAVEMPLFSMSEGPDAGTLPSPGPRTAKMPLLDMISDSLDLLYYGPLDFGTPPQALTVDVDTGSADLWVPAGCTSCPSGKKQFEKGKSGTYKEDGGTFDVFYGSGRVSAALATDVISLPLSGSGSNMSIQQQAFGAVSSESEQFAAYPNSGILGMAFSTISVSGKPTFFENLIKEEKVVEPLFSVHLERGKEVGSEVCFGCYDQSKTTGKVYWVPLVSKTYWPLALDSMSVNGTSALADNIIAVIDTGTTLIYIPEILATKIYKLIPGSKPAPEYGPAFYTFPCDGVFTISLSFGGRNFAIHTVDFNLGPIATNSADCVGGILSLGQGFPPNLAIVGDEFLKSWYSTFDHSNGGRVGFSPSINNKR